MATRMQQRRGTAADWAAANPVLADGEIGFERDTGIFKLGDGITPWTSLPAPFMIKSLIDAPGDLIVGSADNVPARLARGTTGQRLTVQADGTLAWETPTPAIPESLADAVGDLIVGTGPDTFGKLARGATGQRLTVNADGTLGWTNMPDLSGFETSAHAASTFETQAHAASTFETQSAHATSIRRTIGMAVVTNTAVVNNGATWADITQASVSVNEGASSVQPFALTVNVVAGKRYLVDANVSIHNGGSGDESLLQTRISGTAAGNWFGPVNAPVGGQSTQKYFPVTWKQWFVCTTSGTLIVTIQIEKLVGTGANNVGASILMIDDLGMTAAPNGS